MHDDDDDDDSDDDPVAALTSRLETFYTEHGEPDKARNAASIIAQVLKKKGGDVVLAEAAMNKALAGTFDGDTL